MSADLEQDIQAILRSEQPRAEQVTALAELLTVGAIGEVTLPTTRVEVERVEAYGLVLGLDAAGNAVRVEFPNGIAEWYE